MSRQVQLGRAVLDMPNANHELWLTTLITILPEQNATYLAQLTPVKCLESLASGIHWVHCGHDMHVDLTLTLHNEALPYKQLQDLTNAVLRAPIWDQLMLRPSLPADVATAPGTMRLHICHATNNGRNAEQKHHRIFSDVPASDIRPPDGVVSVALQSVRLAMDILGTSPRQKLVTRRPNPPPNGQETSRCGAEETAINLFDPDLTGSRTHCHASNPMPLVSNRKRKRPVTSRPQLGSRGPSPNETDDHVDLGSESQYHFSSAPPSQADMRTMVESALRLSIRGTTSKPLKGCKIKASTFRSGLAHIAPTIWRGGYLDALSHRAQLMPTITQSLVQTAFVKATSVSLKSKTGSTDDTTCMIRQDKDHDLRRATQHRVAYTKSSIAAQLWNHSQKTLLCDPLPPTQACVASDLDKVDLDSDDMLAEKDKEWVSDVYRVNDEGNASSNSGETIDDRRTLPATLPTVISDNHPGRVCQQPSGEPFGNVLSEFDEELLFDSLS